MKLHTIILVLFLIEGCCSTHSNYSNSNRRESERNTESNNHLSLQELKTRLEIRILAFGPSSGSCLTHYSNFVIGINDQGDTLGFVDKDFSGNLLENEIISFSPSNWSQLDKINYGSLNSNIYAKRMQDILCSIKNVYFGKIDCIEPINEALRYGYFDNNVIIPNNDSIKNKLNLEIYTTTSTKVTLKIYNMQGDIILNKESNIYRGFNKVELDVSDLESGFYMLKVIDGTMWNYAQTFSKK